MSKFYNWINESILSAGDLAKDLEGYKNRGQLFLKKLKEGEPFDMADGTKEVLYVSNENIEELGKMVDKSDFSEFSKKIKVYRKSNDKKVPMKAIEKTKEFGSSGGAGTGSAGTALAESAAAMTAAHFIKNGLRDRTEYKKYLDGLSQENMAREFSQVSSNYDVTDSVEDVVQFLLNNRKWLLSSCSTAEAIRDELKLEGSFVLHRGSRTMNEIYKKAKQLLKDAGMKIGEDKWNPGDLWLIKQGSQRYQRLMDTSTIAEFNSILTDSIKSKEFDVVSISLKQCSIKYPSIKWYNLEHNTEDIDIEKIKPGFFVKIPISKNIVIIDTSPPIKLDIRTFQSAIKAKAQGELLAKKARAGKVANTAMRSWLQSHEKGIKFGKYDRKNVLNRDGTWFTDEFVQKFFQRIQELIRLDHIDKSDISKIRTTQDLQKLFKQMYEDDFNGELYKMAAAMSSKIQAMEFAIYATDEFLEFAYSYASSSIKGISGPFVKISTGK